MLDPIRHRPIIPSFIPSSSSAGLRARRGLAPYARARERHRALTTTARASARCGLQRPPPQRRHQNDAPRVFP